MVDIFTIDFPELSDIVGQYPWFSAARAQLCMRQMLQSGYDAAGGELQEALAYVPDVAYVAGRLMSCRPKEDFSDESLKRMIREAIKEKPHSVIAGMDFFSKDEYDQVREDSDSTISRMAAVDSSDPANFTAPAPEQPECDMVTETLAQIYADQGYPEEAEDIYNKLSLQSPEKSAYFASLIDKLKN